MRRTIDFNSGWFFLRWNADAAVVLDTGEAVTLPHTWNAVDGQDGGDDYYRGTCVYAKRFSRPELAEGEEAWLEFEGVGMTAAVSVNSSPPVRHEGGYSTFRVQVTADLLDENILAVSADNGRNRAVYPQKADFTFYGGIYRDVRLIIVPAAHFVLDDHGSTGIKVTPKLAEDLGSAVVGVEAWVRGPAKTLTFSVDGQTKEVEIVGGHAAHSFDIADVRLWSGVRDPYLYTARARLDSGDAVETAFGCRTIAFDADNGFILNGKPVRLCGAARHQDRPGIGSALTRAEQDEDMALMREMGANTVRLAHYQHSAYFYDLCDRYGLAVWAEIPYITEHMPEARENTVRQMMELIVQNRNHPSIVCWGLSNEITAAGGVNGDLIENHRVLNDLCHRLDPTRPTTMAHAFMLDPAEPFAMLSDICSFNLYYGWYLGEPGQNDEWFDHFRAIHPDRVIGLSEYGADANPDYQSDNPERGDWSESYQAVYHEHMLEMWRGRPYIWAMHAWNMFDFGADGREEGGKPGQNQKGLVTFDRKIRKDAFYLYKAYLSDLPFVHLCGSRHVDRTGEVTEVKAYSNLDEIALFVDGVEFGRQAGDKVFRFCVPITGTHTVEARAGACRDTILINRTERCNPAYRMERGDVVNWFDKPEELRREGYFSVFDTMADIRTDPDGAALLDEVMAQARQSYGEMARSVTLPESARRIMERMPLEKVLRQAGKAFSPAMIRQINSALNRVRKSGKV